MSLLRKENYECLGIDVRIPTQQDAANWRFQRCDILDAQQLSVVTAEFKPQFVVHLAARTDIEGVDVAAYAANVAGTQNVIDASASAGTVNRVLFASSQLVCRVGYIPNGNEDYCPVNAYGESKVLSERMVRERMSRTIEWCLLRPTTIWGEGMSSHYQAFLGHLKAGRYFNVGVSPLNKSYGYVGNAVYQISKFLDGDKSLIDKKTFYLGDYAPLSLRSWTNSLARELGAKKPKSLPVFAARILALGGDILNGVGFRKFPFNSYRLRNILTEYIFDMRETEAICGRLPYTVEDGIARTTKWFLQLHAR
jgi:GlcNAc-P-P-Und epimerase